jgi:triosephosphate isomerase (TIM)
VTPLRRQPLVVGNWKMHLGESSAKTLVAKLLSALPFDHVAAAVAPAFPCLRVVLDAVAGSPLEVGAQNMHWEAQGAFTGEVSPTMLAEMGVRFVIVGHSERRVRFGETDAAVSRKIVAARRHGLAPIVCVGENDHERDTGQTRDVVVAQIRAAFADATLPNADDIVIAYEPVWAIGTGRTPQPGEITDAHGAIRQALTERFGAQALAVRVLYGGSVTAASAPSLLRAPEVDGALVGGASLDASSFASIAAAAGSC